MRVAVTLYDDDLPGNQAILISGQTACDSLGDVYDALGEALGHFMRHLEGDRGLLAPDTIEEN